MKKTILIMVALISLSKTHAQKVNFGIKSGLNLTTIHGSDASNAKILPRAYFGAYLNLNITEKIHFQPEVVYSLQGYKFSNYYYYTSIKDHLNYLNLPLLFQYDITKKAYLEAGPQLGYLFRRNLLLTKDYQNGIISNSSSTDTSNINKFDFGIDIGSGYKLTSKFSLNLRYNNSLTKFPTASENFKNNVIQLGANYSF